MAHAPNPQHLPPERSAAELEEKIAVLTIKLQGVCTHGRTVTEKDGPMFREVCPVCDLRTGWQYRDSGNSRTLLWNMWRSAASVATLRMQSLG